jgi:hypothetical protein
MARELSGRYVVVQWKCVGVPSVPLRISLTNAYDKEQTYKWLETAYRDRAVWMSYLAVDPVFDSIRSEARFRDLLHRVGLD